MTHADATDQFGLLSDIAHGYENASSCVTGLKLDSHQDNTYWE